MRQRITYLQNPEDSLDPKNLDVGKAHIKTRGLKAAREEKITFGFEELPKELQEVLKASYEVHIRWVSETAYETRAPIVSRLSPGLHVFYTGQRGGSSELLCPMLKDVLGDLDCVSPEKSFTKLPTERFSHGSALQYYTPLHSVHKLERYIVNALCPKAKESDPPGANFPCCSRVWALSGASSVDINFDTISHALIINAFFPPSIQDLDLVNHAPGNSRMEVGILSVEKALQAEEISLGGFLTVVGEDNKPSPTLFSFPSRHHPLNDYFTSDFIQPTGLHPTLRLDIHGSKPPLLDRSCKIHAHLTLPKEIFVDKYQLEDPLFLASKNLTALHYITTPVDLEAPAYTTNLWGSSVLLELAPPVTNTEEEEPWTAEIPLHLRYLLPNSNKKGIEDLAIPYPVVFWACTADEGSKFPGNPFDRVNLGYDSLFGPRTLFYHLNPEPVTEGGGGGGVLVSHLDVPVLDLDKSMYVEFGTAAAVLLGFGWVVWCLLGMWRGSGYQSHAKERVEVVEEGEKKKTK